MAKFERRFRGDFDAVLDCLHSGILSGSITAGYEEGSDYVAGGVRCAVRVYERYSLSGGNRLSLTLTLIGQGQDLFLSAIAAGAARGCSSRSILGVRSPSWTRSGSWPARCKSKDDSG